MHFFGRKLWCPETLREFEADDAMTAPDEYTHNFINTMTEGTVFVEVSESKDGPFELWKVEIIPIFKSGPLALLVARCTEADALKAIKESGTSPCQ